MFIVESYSLAIVFCFVTMLCWGSWGNTQKLAQKSWRYELFYWDYVIGMVLAALLLGGYWGGLAGAVGMTIADLTTSYVTSAPKTFFLKLVGSDFFHQPDAAAFLIEVHYSSATLFFDHFMCAVELVAAVASLRSEDVACHA